ncbi:Uncharacterized protein APZ42_032847 [Daphnia magna]|uniref:Transmembrane protein n=1 Tax=Daphnia magna TaxID=35525 RepID=A0A164LX87_9CRUS|nr:Uncharacterized protein APZ42_032847 [Daphnia magna]
MPPKMSSYGKNKKRTSPTPHTKKLLYRYRQDEDYYFFFLLLILAVVYFVFSLIFPHA